MEASLRGEDGGVSAVAALKPNGDFFNVAPAPLVPSLPKGRTYNTTQGLVALTALGIKPRHDPLPVFEAILKEDYKQLPRRHSTSFSRWRTYVPAGPKSPKKADLGIRALMVQDETGYTNDHVAATFHASHYYRLVGEETPRSKEMVARVLRDQKPDGSWFLNMPGRDRHATFDAVFTLVHEGHEFARGAECRRPRRQVGSVVPQRRRRLRPLPRRSTSDAERYLLPSRHTRHGGGSLKPSADPLPRDPHLLSMGPSDLPVVKTRPRAPRLSLAFAGLGGRRRLQPHRRPARCARPAADKVARIFDQPERARRI